MKYFSLRDGVACFSPTRELQSGLQIPLETFGQLLQKHLDKYPTTLDIERLGEQLVRLDFPPKEMTGFVTEVCGWAGKRGNQVKPRILKNSADDMRAKFRSALSSLAVASVAEALQRVTLLHGLRTSFASKHLRFLKPDLCPVFDSVLQHALPYPFTPVGYAHFCVDCDSIATALKERRISNPRGRVAGSWFRADVEGALFIAAGKALPRR